MKEGISIQATIVTLNNEFILYLDASKFTKEQIEYLKANVHTKVDVIIQKEMKDIDKLRFNI